MRQAEYFASDQLLKDRASIWRDVPPEECLAATMEECAAAAFFLSRLDVATIARLNALDEFPADTLAIFARLVPSP